MKWTFCDIDEARLHFEHNSVIISGFIFDSELIEIFVKYIVPVSSKQEPITYDYKNYFVSLKNLRTISPEKYNSAILIMDKDVFRVTRMKKIVTL